MGAVAPRRRCARQQTPVRQTSLRPCPTSSLWSNASNELKFARFGAPWRRLPPPRVSVAAGEVTAVPVVVVLDAGVHQLTCESTGFAPVVSAPRLVHGNSRSAQRRR